MRLPHLDQTGGGPHEHDDSTGATSSAAFSSREESPDAGVEGTWGEHDVGGPVSHRMAMEDYGQLRRELTQLSQIRSRSTIRTGREGLFRSVTGRGTKSRRTAGSGNRRTASVIDDASVTEGEDLETGDAATAAEKEEEFELGDFIRDGHFEKRTDRGESAKKVGVVFKNLTVKGVGASASFVRTLPDAVLGKKENSNVSIHLGVRLMKRLRYFWPRSVSHTLRLHPCVEVWRSWTDAKSCTRLYRSGERWRDDARSWTTWFWLLHIPQGDCK